MLLQVVHLLKPFFISQTSFVVLHPGAQDETHMDFILIDKVKTIMRKKDTSYERQMMQSYNRYSDFH